MHYISISCLRNQHTIRNCSFQKVTSNLYLISSFTYALFINPPAMVLSPTPFGNVSGNLSTIYFCEILAIITSINSIVKKLAQGLQYRFFKLPHCNAVAKTKTFHIHFHISYILCDINFWTKDRRKIVPIFKLKNILYVSKLTNQ